MKTWLWFLCGCLVVLILVAVIGETFSVGMLDISWFSILFLTLPIVCLISHAIYTLGFKRATLFIGLSMFVGWLAETWGLKGGWLFGGEYEYARGQMSIGLVPVIVVCFWGVFIYTGYTMTNSLLIWLGNIKPNIQNKKLLLLLLLLILDGWFVVAIDLFMDPLQVFVGRWGWVNGGAYFGVPLGNFVGWFLVTITVTGLFRMFEYFKPRDDSLVDSSLLILPTIGYGALAGWFLVSAIQAKMFSLAFWGSAFMFTNVLICAFVLAITRPKASRLTS